MKNKFEFSLSGEKQNANSIPPNVQSYQNDRRIGSAERAGAKSSSFFVTLPTKFVRLHHKRLQKLRYKLIAVCDNSQLSYTLFFYMSDLFKHVRQRISPAGKLSSIVQVVESYQHISTSLI